MWLCYHLKKIKEITETDNTVDHAQLVVKHLRMYMVLISGPLAESSKSLNKLKIHLNQNEQYSRKPYHLPKLKKHG